jgi:hypothetical protein
VCFQVVLALHSLPVVDVLRADGETERYRLVRSDDPAVVEGHFEPSSAPNRVWVRASPTLGSADSEVRGAEDIAQLFAAMRDALVLASRFEAVINPSAESGGDGNRDGTSSAAAAASPSAAGYHGHAAAASRGAGGHAAHPGDVSAGHGRDGVVRRSSNAHELLQKVQNVSSTMDTVAKRFRSLLKAFFLVHPVNDVSPFRTRQREQLREQMRDVARATAGVGVGGVGCAAGGAAAGGGVPGTPIPGTPFPGTPYAADVRRSDSDDSAAPVSSESVRKRLIRFVESNGTVLNGIIGSHPDLLSVRPAA